MMFTLYQAGSADARDCRTSAAGLDDLPRVHKNLRKLHDYFHKVAEAPWSVAQWAVALRFDNP